MRKSGAPVRGAIGSEPRTPAAAVRGRKSAGLGPACFAVRLAVLFAAALGAAGVHAQQPAPGAAVPEPGAQQQGAQQQGPAPGLAAPAIRYDPDYVLGGGDQISIRAFEMPEISAETYLVDGEGYVNLPALGRVRAGSLTVRKFEESLVSLLRPYVREPEVRVTVMQFRSEPVFFIGAFRSPGIYPLQGRRRLVEMLSSIGGLQPNASRRLTLTRRAEYGEIPLPHAERSADGATMTVQIGMGSLTSDVDPAEDLVLQPFDLITVERAERVYLMGGVRGSIEVDERQSLSVAKAITLAGGMAPGSKPKKARVLRPVMNSSRRAAIPVNVDEILEGKANDFPLLPNDMLYVPHKDPSRSFWRSARWFVPIATTVALITLQVRR